MSTGETPREPFAGQPFAAVWLSPFRPFGAAGMAYGVVLMAAWLLAREDVMRVPGGMLTLHDWHSHEMVFGFAVAIICATVLTALPSWAGTREIRGGRLAGLVALWLLGRAAFAAYGIVPLALVIAAAVALQAALIAMLAPDLFRLGNRYYLLLLVILAGMLAGDVLFLSGRVDAGLTTGLYAIVLTFALKAGVFAPIFTGNHLRATRRGDQAPFLMPLEFAAIGAIFVLAAVDLGGAPPQVRALAAFAAGAIHLVRLVRWRGWLVLDIPLLWTMHVAYAWMVIAFLLMGIGHLGAAAAASVAWHAFVVGSLGSMMLGLMTRVALRHTGRRLVPPSAVIGAYWLVQLAAALRLAAPFAAGGDAWIVASGSAWIAAFAIYLACFGRILLSPSLPRGAPPPLAGVVKDMSDVR